MDFSNFDEVEKAYPKTEIAIGFVPFTSIVNWSNQFACCGVADCSNLSYYTYQIIPIKRKADEAMEPPKRDADLAEFEQQGLRVLDFNDKGERTDFVLDIFWMDK